MITSLFAELRSLPKALATFLFWFALDSVEQSFVLKVLSHFEWPFRTWRASSCCLSCFTFS